MLSGTTSWPLRWLGALFLAKLFADSACAGSIFHTPLAKSLPNLETEIVKRSNRARGSVPLPRRWIVKRTIAWLNRCRRLAKYWENLNRNALALTCFHPPHVTKAMQSLMKSPDGLSAVTSAAT
jgi:transposase